MVMGQIVGLLANSPDFYYYLNNEDTKTSLFGKFALWYLCSIVGVICSIVSM